MKPDNNKMTVENIEELGFEKNQGFTIEPTYNLDIGRRRVLSISGLGTHTEVLFLSEHDTKNKKQINDIVCLHNYDYDGFLTTDKLKLLLLFINTKNK